LFAGMSFFLLLCSDKFHMARVHHFSRFSTGLNLFSATYRLPVIDKVLCLVGC
jgi:hypothetical protein